MRLRTLGDVEVSSIGLGAMELSAKGRPDRERALATVRAAVDAGVTIIDTADAYGFDASEIGHNEALVAEALATCGSDGARVLVATKGGHRRDELNDWSVDGRPWYLKRACEHSLTALGVDAIDLYQLHRPDPKVPYAESIGALADLREAGKIRRIGISNATTTQIQTAVATLGPEALTSVQNRFSVDAQESRAEVELCEALGIAFMAYSPLGGLGNHTGMGTPGFSSVASARGVSVQQIVLAWELAASPCVIPIPGCSRPETIRDSACAESVDLTAAELELLGAAT